MHTPKIRHFGIKGVSYSKLCGQRLKYLRDTELITDRQSLQTDSPFGGY